MDAKGSTDLIFDSKEWVADYKNSLIQALEFVTEDKISEIVGVLFGVKERNGALFICGNGGSAANAEHLANDFLFGVSPNGNAFKVEALNANTAVLTCLANDIGYENIYAHQLKVKAQAGDVLLVLSGSGNSKNISNAIEQAKRQNIMTIAIVGYNGGVAKSIADICLHIKINDMQISEDVQVVVGHILMKCLNKIISPE